MATSLSCLYISHMQVKSNFVPDVWLWMIFTCRKFQVGSEKFLIHWLLVINRKSSEVPMIDVNLVCLALILSFYLSFD